MITSMGSEMPPQLRRLLDEHEQNDMYSLGSRSKVSRRALLGGVLVGGVGIALGAAKGLQERSGRRTPEELRLAGIAREEALTRSTTFAEAVREAADVYGTRHEFLEEGAERSELDIMLDRNERYQIEGRSSSAFFRDEALADIREEEIPPVIQRELSHLVQGLIAYESHYENVAKGPAVRTRLPSKEMLESITYRGSEYEGVAPVILREYADGSILVEEHALSRIQAKPSTFVEYGFAIKDIQDPRAQAAFIGKYFKEAYRVFRETSAFNAIRLKYFPGDYEGFQKHFLVPAMLNAYHSGMGTIQDLVRWFAERRLRQELVGKGYEVFHAMTELALERKNDLRGDARSFGPEGKKYVPHGYALAGLVQAADERRQAHLPA